MAAANDESGDADSVEDVTELRRRNGVQSIDRAVAILRCFDGRRPELGISELARTTGLSTSTVHRLLGAMQQNHLVRQTAAKRYGLGPFVLQLANSGAMPRTFREAALPFMTDLRNEFDETVGLHELVGGAHRIVTAQVESHQELRRTYTDIGVPIKLVHGAPGKAILSAMTAADCERCLAGPIEPITTSTLVDPEAIRRELEIARTCGYPGHVDNAPSGSAPSRPPSSTTPSTWSARSECPFRKCGCPRNE